MQFQLAGIEINIDEGRAGFWIGNIHSFIAESNYSLFMLMWCDGYMRLDLCWMRVLGE